MSGSMIKQAAIKFEDEIWTLPRPARHHNILWAMHDVLENKDPSVRPKIVPAKGEQGFVDEKGKFYNRMVAAIHAVACGQVEEKKLIAPPNLYSEDLW